MTHPILTTACLLAMVCSVAPNRAHAQRPSGNEKVVLTGVIETLWGDPPLQSGLSAQVRYFLYDDRGEMWELLIDEQTTPITGGMIAVSRQTVTVRGEIVPWRARAIYVDSIEVGGVDTDIRGPTGSQPYIWILVRFADNASTPEQPAWFSNQALGPYPSLDHFWREVSFNTINLIGSDVVGWYTLPQPRSYYVYDIDPNDPGDELDFDRAVADATAVADDDVYFPAFTGINLIFNDDLDGPSWGGGAYLTLDGQALSYGVTYMPPTGWRKHAILGHEMGHTFYLPHCSGPYGWVYDSQWALMSGCDGTGAVADPVYGSLGVNLIAFHKHALNWIPTDSRYQMPTTPTVTTLVLHDLAVPAPVGRMHIAMVLWPDDVSQRYTFERRCWTGYDQNVPGEAVIVHWNNPDRDIETWVVDPDNDGDCNDEGAMFNQGESFVDTTNTIVATIEHEAADYSVVTLTNAARDDVFVDWSNAAGFQQGSPTYPWDTVYEGCGAAFPNGDVWIVPGNYPETLTLRKPVVLRRWGSAGVVRIGQ